MAGNIDGKGKFGTSTESNKCFKGSMTLKKFNEFKGTRNKMLCIFHWQLRAKSIDILHAFLSALHSGILSHIWCQIILELNSLQWRSKNAKKLRKGRLQDQAVILVNCVSFKMGTSLKGKNLRPGRAHSYL